MSESDLEGKVVKAWRYVFGDIAEVKGRVQEAPWVSSFSRSQKREFKKMGRQFKEECTFCFQCDMHEVLLGILKGGTELSTEKRSPVFTRGFGRDTDLEITKR